jgi:hypothetical protein
LLAQERREFGKAEHTDFLVSSKKIFAESGILSSLWAFVPAPLIPEVALVELPPMKLQTKKDELSGAKRCEFGIPLLVKEKNISASLEETVSSRETSETASDNDCLCHYMLCVEDGGWWM